MNVIFREERVKESDEVKDGVIVDYGFDGNIVGFEVLDATKHVCQPNAVTYERKKELV